MTFNLPVGDLARVKSIEPNDEWPTMIEVVAWFGKEGRKGKRRSVEIPADQFYGRNSYSAPMDGNQLIGIIDRLRRQK